MDEPEAPAPWIAAHSMLERAHVPPYDLEEVSVDLPVWRRPAAKKAQEPIMPRRTRSTTRLVDAVAQLDDDMDLDEPEEGTRRSRRAEQLAAKKRSDDLRERAERVLGPQALGEEEEEEEEDGEPMHLESKIACLVRLCDLMSTPKGVPASSSMHRLVQPLIDSLPALEKEAREHVAKVKNECEATMNALQKKAPSMVSPRYNAWKEERKNLGLANDHAVRTAQAEQYVSVARCTPRSGPLGRDLDGNEYWHLCPDVASAGALPPFSGHWSQVLVVYGRSPGGVLVESSEQAASQADADAKSEPAEPAEPADALTDAADAAKPPPSVPAPPTPAFYGTGDAEAIGQLHTYLHHHMEHADLSEHQQAEQAALLASLAQVQSYIAWVQAEVAARGL